MCTVSWQFNDTGYQLFFNRDELNTRQRALLPEIKQHQEVHFIAPTDTDAGGTWISINEYGVALCLLNNYAAQAQMADRKWISRGQLVHELSHVSNIDVLINAIIINTLERYRPFDLIALSLNGHSCQLSWDGSNLKVTQDPGMPLTSSSFQTEAVIQSRLQQFRQAIDKNGPQAQQFRQYHASHLPERGAFSVCMHRDNGQTVSFSHINVDTSQASFNYYDGSPCSVSEAHTTRLDIKTEYGLMSQQPLTALS